MRVVGLRRVIGVWMATSEKTEKRTQFRLFIFCRTSSGLSVWN